MRMKVTSPEQLTVNTPIVVEGHGQQAAGFIIRTTDQLFWFWSPATRSVRTRGYADAGINAYESGQFSPFYETYIVDDEEVERIESLAAEAQRLACEDHHSSKP